MSRAAESPMLLKLPPAVFREACRRLAAGERVKKVVGWLMACHRGELQHEVPYLIRKYLIELRAWLEGPQEGSDALDLTSAERDIQAKLSQMTPTSRMLQGKVIDAALKHLDSIAELQDLEQRRERPTQVPTNTVPEGGQE